MKISNEAKVGVLATIALIILITGYSYLKGQQIFSSQNEFFAEYTKVDGLLTANPILMNGLQVGMVDKIYMKSDGTRKIIVKMMIDEDVPVPQNAQVRIVSAGLLGDKAINLEFPEKETSIMAKTGDQLLGIAEVSMVDKALNEIDPIKSKVEKMVVTVDSILVSVDELLKSSDMKKTLDNFSKSIENVQNALENVDGILANVNNFTDTELKNVGGIIRNVESISTKLEKDMNSVDRILATTEKITGNAEVITKKMANLEVEETVASANATLDQINKLTAKIDSGEGSMGLLMNDKQLYNNLSDLSSSLDFLVNDLQQNPKNYLGFSLINVNKKDKKKKPKKGSSSGGTGASTESYEEQ